MLQKPLKPMALLLVAGLFCSQNLYAFGPASLTLGAPSFTPAITHNPVIFIQNQKVSHPIELAQYGVDKLGASLGMDPRMSSLIAAPISAGIGTAFDTGRNVGVSIINSVQAGMIQGALSYGISFTGTQNPLIGSLMSRDITNNLALAIGRDGLFNTVFNILGKTALNVVNVVGGAVKTVFDGITSFGTTIQQKGLAGALESFVPSMFDRNAQEAILQKGGVQGLLNSTSTTPVTLRDGSSAQELIIDQENSLYFDDVSNLIGRKAEGIYQLGEFGYDSHGNFALLEGDVYANLGDDLTLYGGVRDGQFVSIKIDGPSETLLEVDPEKKNAPIYIEGPNGNTSGYSFWNAALNMLPDGLRIALGNGVAYSAEIATSGPSPVSQSPNQNVLYGLVNGIANKETNPSTPPDYIRNLEADLVTQSGLTLSQGADFVKSALYQSWQFLKLGSIDLNSAKDIVRVIMEMQAQAGISSLKVMSDFDTYFAYSANDRLRPMVDVGYSGGFIPLVKAIDERKYSAETVVALGAATSLVFGIPADRRDDILAFIQQGSFGLALQMVQEFTGSQTAGLPNLSGSSVKRIVNVYGTADILNQVGIGGYRNTICGVPALNIEIAGATHFDYMRRSDETNPAKADFNKRVSKFVTDLTLASNDDAKLLAFLQRTMVAPDSDGVWRFHP